MRPIDELKELIIQFSRWDSDLCNYSEEMIEGLKSSTYQKELENIYRVARNLQVISGDFIEQETLHILVKIVKNSEKLRMTN